MQSVPDAYDPQYTYWLRLAQKALAAAGYVQAQLNWLSQTHNAVFKVEYSGEQSILRLHQPDSIAQVRLQSEVTWLQALRQAGIQAVPEVRAVVHLTDDAGRAVSGVLFAYLPGISKTPHELSAKEWRAIGSILGRIHRVAQSFDPPSGFDRPRLDFTGLFETGGLYDPGENHVLFEPEQLAVIQSAMDRVRAAFDALDFQPVDFGMIHGDLLLKNVLFRDNHLYVLDFEFCGWGSYLYDLAPLLWQLKSDARYEVWADYVMRGYFDVIPEAAEHANLIENLIVARQIASMRWLARNQQLPMVAGRATDLIDQRATELRQFLKTGKLLRHSVTL